MNDPLILEIGATTNLMSALETVTGLSNEALLSQYSAFLKAELGVSGTALVDMERQWLEYQTSLSNTDINRLLRVYLEGLGYTGALSEMVNKAAADAVLFSPRLLLALLTGLGDGSTFSGGGQTVEQYDGSLVTVAADISAHSGMRLTYDPDEGAILGDELVAGWTSESWSPYGTNTIEDDGAEVKVTRVDNNSGAYLDVSVEVGKKYRATLLSRVNAGASIEWSLYSPAGLTDLTKENAIVTQTTRSPVTMIATATHTLMRIYFVSFAGGEICWASDVSLTEVTPAFVNSDTSGYLCHPVDSNGLSLTYDERVDSTPYDIGDKAYSGRFVLTCTVDGTSHTSAPSITSTDLGSTVVDGGVTWSVDSWYQVSRGYLGEEARTNKCTCHKANPTVTTNITLSGDPAATLTLVDDSAALAAAGLDTVCTSGQVYKLDNSAGIAIAWAYIGGNTGNTNPHTLSIYGRGTGAIAISGNYYTDRADLNSGVWTRVVKAGTIPPVSTAMAVFCAAGEVAYFILPQMEEGSFATSPIYATPETLAAVTRPKTVASLPTANVLPVNNFGIDMVVTPLAGGQDGWVATLGVLDASNYCDVRVTATNAQFRKRLDTFYSVTAACSHVAGQQLRIQLFQASSDGMGIRTKGAGEWSAWSVLASDGGKLDAIVSEYLEIGSRAGDLPFNAHYENLQIYKTSDPKSKLESIG